MEVKKKKCLLRFLNLLCEIVCKETLLNSSHVVVKSYEQETIISNVSSSPDETLAAGRLRILKEQESPGRYSYYCSTGRPSIQSRSCPQGENLRTKHPHESDPLVAPHDQDCEILRFPLKHGHLSVCHLNVFQTCFLSLQVIDSCLV
jgi:hypothetical protein